METPIFGNSKKRTVFRTSLVVATSLGLLAAITYFGWTPGSRAEAPAEQMKLIDRALGSDDEAERLTASRRLAELNREALKRIKRLRVLITICSRPDVHVSLSLPETAKNLLAASGITLADSKRGATDGILHIRACCWPDGREYTGGYKYSGAWVGGTVLLEMGGRLVYAGAFSFGYSAPWVTGWHATEPSGAPFEPVMGWGLLPVLAPLLDDEAVPTLLQLGKENAYKREEGAKVDRALDQIDSPKVVQRLVTALKDSEAAVRWIAAGALGRRRDGRALEALIGMLKDGDQSVRRASVEALGKLKDPRAADALVPILTDSDENVRWAAAVALCELGDKRGLEPALAGLADGRWGFGALGELGDPRAVDPLIAAAKSAAGQLRHRVALGYGLAAALALARLEYPRARAAFVDLVTEGAFLVVGEKDRQKVADAFTRLKRQVPVQRLVDALQNRSAVAREVVAAALGGLGDPSAVVPLTAALKDQSDDHVPVAAAEALGRLKDPRAVEPLVAALANRDRLFLPLTAAAALGKLKDSRAVTPLMSVLAQERPKSETEDTFNETNDLRHAAAKALGELGDSRAIEPLRSLLKRECSPAAVTALVRLELRSRQAGGR